MTEERDREAKPDEQGGQEQAKQQCRWRDRPTIHALQQDARSAWSTSDLQANEASRLPDTEEVQLRGFVLSEVYPPSSLSSIRKALEDLATTHDEREKWTARLAEGRSGAGAYGWLDLGIIRRSDRPGLLQNRVDRKFPRGIDEIWLRLYFPIPSLTFMVATFTLTDQTADLSDLLRADYKSDVHVDIGVLGSFSAVRSRIPWSRPARYTESGIQDRTIDQKREACEVRIKARQADCWKWLTSRFPGRFSAEDLDDFPVVRLLLTKEAAPFQDNAGWLAPAGLAFGPDIWRPAEPYGWFLRLSDWPRERRFTAIAARKLRTDEVEQSGNMVRFSPREFTVGYSSLVARWAMNCLLSVYGDSLATLRDDAGRRRPGSRPVRQGGDLEKYLIRDGLDASTVISELDEFTKDLDNFRLGVPEYTEYLDPFPERARAANPSRQMIPWLCERLRDQAQRLGRDTTAATENIRASAELRQAIANTKLQRVTVSLTIIAVVIALISLVVAINAGQS